jgi:hypothetical protein
MMTRIKTTFFLLLIGICLAGSVCADEARLVRTWPQKCEQGLHPQPNHGPFSVYLFCDDALGSNIGIILTERGAGPGNVALNDLKVWNTWDTVNRFWQDRTWAADVMDFAWGPSQRYLYVATSGIYGDGGFFKIDLRERTSQRLMPRPNAPYESMLRGRGFSTNIKSIDLEQEKITVDISFYQPKEEGVATEVFPFE